MAINIAENCQNFELGEKIGWVWPKICLSFGPNCFWVRRQKTKKQPWFYATRLFQNELYQEICFLDLVSSSHNILAFSSRQWSFFSICGKVYLLGTKVNQPPVFTQMHNVSVSNQTRLKAETSTRYTYRWWDRSSKVTALWPFRKKDIF